jgi:hypothetical protein
MVAGIAGMAGAGGREGSLPGDPLTTRAPGQYRGHRSSRKGSPAREHVALGPPGGWKRELNFGGKSPPRVYHDSSGRA